MPSSTTESRDETQSRCLVRNLRTETRSREEILRIRVPGQAGKAEQPGNRDVGVYDGDERIGRRRRPGQDGGCSSGGNSTLVYFGCEDCSVEEGRVAKSGGSIHKKKFSIGRYGFISLAVDTEGNMFGLHSMK